MIRWLFAVATLAGISAVSHAQVIFIHESDTVMPQKKESRIDFDVEAGSWNPMGKLRNTFQSGVSVAARMGVPVWYRFRIDVGLQFNTPSNAERIDYNMPDSVVAVSGARTYVFLFGARGIHESRINSYWVWEQSAGAGFGVISAYQPVIESKGSDPTWYRIGTLQLTTGAAIYRVIGTNKSIGVFMDYNFAPYALFGKVNKGFGNSYFRTGLRMRILQSPPMLQAADENGWFLPEERNG